MSKEQFEKYKKTKDSIRSLISYVESEKKKLKENASQDILDKVEEFYQFLKSYDTEKLRPKPTILTGDFFDFEDMKQRLQEHTGYLWKTRELLDKELEERDPYLEFRYNLKADNFKAYEFYRKSNNRSELWLLILYLLPGCALVHYDTGRVGGATEICNTPDELMKSFERHCG